MRSESAGDWPGGTVSELSLTVTVAYLSPGRARANSGPGAAAASRSPSATDELPKFNLNRVRESEWPGTH
jgi:hypothetical protein